MSKEVKTVGQVAQEQIDAWKAQYGDVYSITTEDAQESLHVCYLKKPKRKHISAATIAGKVDPLKFNETLMRECWLGGSEAIRTDDDMFMAAGGVLTDIVQIREAQLEKL